MHTLKLERVWSGLEWKRLSISLLSFVHASRRGLCDYELGTTRLLDLFVQILAQHCLRRKETVNVELQIDQRDSQEESEGHPSVNIFRH